MLKCKEMKNQLFPCKPCGILMKLKSVGKAVTITWNIYIFDSSTYWVP